MAQAMAMSLSVQLHEYRLPVIVSVLLHALIVFALALNLSFCEREFVLPPVPTHVRAVVVERTVAPPPITAAPELPPKSVPKPAAKPPERQIEISKPKPKPASKPKPAAVKPVPVPVPVPKEQPKPSPPPPDFSALLAEEERELAEGQAVRQAASQKAQQDAALQSVVEARVVVEHTRLIQDALRPRWSRPPGARNGMQTVLRITLLPGGEVLDVQLVKSSGDAAFDRSAENAVRLAGRLPVPNDPVVFNKNFRRFTFTFKPEDLDK